MQDISEKVYIGVLHLFSVLLDFSDDNVFVGIFTVSKDILIFNVELVWTR